MKNLFTYSKNILKTLSVFAIFVLTATGCETKPDPSIYDPNFKGSADPVVTSVSPATEGLAGVTVVTITGSNFSSKTSENFVSFNTFQGTVLEASPTSLKVRLPNVVLDSTVVRVGVLSALNWGYYSQKFNIKAAAEEYGNFKNGMDIPFSVAADATGNVYVSLTSSNVGAGIIKIAPDGTKTQFAKKGSETTWSAIKMGPNNELYAARSQKAIFKIVQDGTGGTSLGFSGIGTIFDFDFDKNLNIWAGGNNDYIYSAVIASKTVKSFPFKANVRSVRVYNDGGKDYVYLAAKVDTVEKIVRMEIQSDAADKLGPVEDVFNFSQYFPGNSVLAITFSQDGDMYIGTDHKDAIIIVHKDKTYESLYKGVLYSKAQNFAWTGNSLFYSRYRVDTSQTIVKVNVGKPGAVYYGR